MPIKIEYWQFTLPMFTKELDMISSLIHFALNNLIGLWEHSDVKNRSHVLGTNHEKLTWKWNSGNYTPTNIYDIQSIFEQKIHFLKVQAIT